MAIAFIISLASGPLTLPLLIRLKLGQNIRDDGPKSHLQKAGTPSMGGIIIVLGAVLSTVIFTRGSFEWVIFGVLTTAGYMAVGFLDDFIKVYKKRSLGLKPYQKIIGQLGLAIVISMFAYTRPEIGSVLYIPIAHVNIDLGIFFIPFTVFVVVAIVNSVNLTDGLDGLASGVSVIVCSAFAIIAFGLAKSAQAAGETYRAVCLNNTAVFGSAAAGACLAFMKFNSYPAKVFMGDTGSLALGGIVSVLCIVTRMQLLLPLIGGMFVLSSLSSVIQMVSYRLKRKRVFKMAPIHHHFELSGIHETRVVAMYIGITLLLSLFAFAILAI